MTNNFEIIRTVKKGWTKQPNGILHDEKLTSDAKVVLYYLLSVSGDYHISEAGIASSIHISLERVKKAVKLLKSTGYINVSRVMNNNRLSGYNWTIADANGALHKGDFRKTENPTTENPTDGISDGRNFRRSENRLTENPPIYEYNEEYQQTNNERQKNEHTEWNESLHHQPDGEDAAVFPPSNSTVFTSQFSSVANAPSLSNKNNQPQAISQKEYLYQQFLKKYPKRPTGSEAAATKEAFFEIPDLENNFEMIMAGLDDWCNSVDWNKEGGRYITKPLNFITLKKWEEIPRTIKTEIDPGLLKFITVDMEEYL